MAIDSFSGEHRFLSNFYPAPVEIDGISYPTAEHAYQASKTHDTDEILRVSRLETAGQAKREGRRLTLRPDWDEVKENMMRAVLVAKFGQNPELKDKLLATGGEVLIEGNTWHDQIWGSCNCPRHIDIPGQNLLGKNLMDIRTMMMGWWAMCEHCSYPVIWAANLQRWICSNTRNCGRRK